MEFTFEQLPSAVSSLNDKIDKILSLMSSTSSPEKDVWFDLKDLSKYIPGNPARPTIYKLVGAKDIPFHKKGKRLYFLKSEIDFWLKSGRERTNKELKNSAKDFLKIK